MTSISINDLLKKSGAKTNGQNLSSGAKSAQPIRTNTGDNAGTNTPARKTCGIKLPSKSVESKTPDEKTGNPIHAEKQIALSPTQALAGTLQNFKTGGIPSIKSVLGQNAVSAKTASTQHDATSKEISQQIEGSATGRASSFHNPTLEDVSKFVFKEQPDDSTLEITERLSVMLDQLNSAVGSDVPTNLARCLEFIKQHAFTADLLKPEGINYLVTAMRKSYGYIVQYKTEKSTKKASKQIEMSEVEDILAGLSF